MYYSADVCGELFQPDVCAAVVTHGRVCVWSLLGLGSQGLAGQALWDMLDHLSHLGVHRGRSRHHDSLPALAVCVNQPVILAHLFGINTTAVDIIMF